MDLPPPPTPAIVSPEIVFGSVTVRVGPRTKLLSVEIDGRRTPARAVRPGPRRVAVPLPPGTRTIRARALGNGPSRWSPPARLRVLPRAGMEPGRTPGFVDPRLQRDVRALVGDLPATGGVYARHLVTGCGASHNAAAQFHAASTLKVAILIEAVRTGRARRLAARLDDMIIDSDTASANVVVADVGGGDPGAGGAAVTATLGRLGLARSRVGRGYVLDARTPLVNRTVAAPIVGSTIFTTPFDLAMLMVAVHRGAVGAGGLAKLGISEREARRELLSRLLRVRDDTNLAAGVPARMRLAHKSGFTPTVKHDAGIVYARSGPIVVAGMTWNGHGVSDAAGSRFLAELARAAVRRLEGGGRCGVPLSRPDLDPGAGLARSRG